MNKKWEDILPQELNILSCGCINTITKYLRQAEKEGKICFVPNYDILYEIVDENVGDSHKITQEILKLLKRDK